MESILKKISSVQYELTVEIGREELARYLTSAENNLSRDFQVDGFRKGKVPRELLRKHLGDQTILEAALDIAVKDSLSKTIHEKDLDVLDASGLKVVENSSQKLVYKVSLSLFPNINIPELGTIKAKRKEVIVRPEEVDHELEEIRKGRAVFLEKDGAVEVGDRAEIDFEILLDGKPIEGGISKNHPLIVGKNIFIPGFEDKLIGMDKDEEKKFSLKAPEDYFNKDIAGKELDFKVKVIDIKKVQIPALDDNFAKSIGKFSDLEDFKNNLEKGILEEKREKERQRVLLEVLEEVMGKADISLSDQMVSQKLDEMISGFDQDLHQRGMELSLYLAHINKTQEDLRKDWKINAEKQLKTELIIRKIAKDKKIEAADGEVEALINQTMQAMALRGGGEANNLDVEKLRADAISQVVRDKTLAYIERTCVA